MPFRPSFASAYSNARLCRQANSGLVALSCEWQAQQKPNNGVHTKLIKRSTVDRLIDRFRFRLDRFPSLDYQPLPWMGLPSARRAQGVATRWEVMEPIIRGAGVETALDVGCNVGFFSISLAKMGVSTVGVEGYDKYFRLFQHTKRTLKLENLSCLDMYVSPKTVRLLAKTDCVLLLSVWHHFVKYYGFETATNMLGTIWNRADKLLFFESGEVEMTADWGLPSMAPTPEAFLREYLEVHCTGGTVEHLGSHKAFSPVTHTLVDRNLFVVKRSHA